MDAILLWLKVADRIADLLTMSDDRKPSYEFFLSPQPATSSPPALTDTALTPPASGPVLPDNVYLGPPPGTVLPAPTGSAPPAWNQPGYGYGPPPPRSGLPLWLVALIATAMALVILGILAAIAIPVFLNQRAKSQWQATSVALPGSFAGLDRLSGTKVDALIKTMAQPPIEAKDVGAYGTLGPDIVVVVAIKSPAAMTEAHQALERADFFKGLETTGYALTKLNDAGPLGGWFGCTPVAPAKPTVTICMATDQGSIFSAIMGPDVINPEQVAQQARTATITRH
jgi:hypothetical protein